MPPGFELTPPQTNSNDETDGSDYEGLVGGDIQVKDERFSRNSSNSDDIELDSWG